MDDPPRTLDELAALVARMRAAQRTYYRQRRYADPAQQHALLNAALELEAEVDEALRRIAEDRSQPLFPRGTPGD